MPTCIGCCACTSVAPEFWEMRDEKGEQKAHLIGSETNGKSEQILHLDKIEDNMDAAEVCPVNCIHIEEKGQRKI